ncbi:MAG: DUF1848 domain-containing protein [Pseudomonadota bacterium]
MIVSASYRTDVPAFQAHWFAERLARGWVETPNPYGGKPTLIRLDAAHADGFVFWTRNVAPFFGVLDGLKAERRPFVVTYTLTGYPRALDPRPPRAEVAIAQIRALSQRFGRDSVVWRYDPIVETTLTPQDWRRSTFADLAQALSTSVDEVCVSWASIYRKTRRNLDRAATEHGFAWRDPDDDEKRATLRDLAAIAADCGLRMTLCSQPTLTVDGVAPAACIDAERLSRVAGYAINAKRKPNRPGCLCAESRDIGRYDNCAHGCAYCYAVRNHDAALKTNDA